LKDEIKAGIIVVTSLVILSGLIIAIGGTKLFTEHDLYSVKFMNVAGLETGAQVRLGGVRIGRVLSIDAPHGPGQPVHVEVGITQGTKLYQGTRAVISQVGFVGDVYLLLSVENTKPEVIEVGSVIPSDEKVQFDAMMARLDNLSRSVDTIIHDMNKIFSQKNLDSIEQLIGNTNEAIVSGSSHLDEIATAMTGTIQRLEIVLNEIEALVKDNKSNITEIIKKTREDVEKTGFVIERIGKTADSADRAIESQSRNIEDLIQNMSETTLDLQDLIHELKNKPWSLIYKEKSGE
jgi:ABC-type transporter Mla subunit MlaD